MENTCKVRPTTSIIKEISNEKILFTHKLQRPEGVWSTSQKSLLIDSLLRGYPINPTYSVKENGVLYIIDGVQRFSTIYSYVAGGFSLSKTLKPVIIDGKKYKIASKKFSKLDEVVQSKILDTEIQLYEISDFTDDEVRQMFARLNSGKALSNTNKRTVLEDNEVGETINMLSSHEFFNKVSTKAQIKSDVPKDIIRQVLMLTTKYDVTSFKSKDIDNFIIWYNGNQESETIKLVTDALDKLNTVFEEPITVKKLVTPLMIYGMCKTIKAKKSTHKYVEWLKKFLEGYDKNADFLQYCGSGTSSADMVKGRVDYFKSSVNKL